jgi:two-component system, chemotaxis family, chemotaxis protein CheY
MQHTILVVEDEEDLRESMRDALEFEGYNVVVAAHGADALTSLDHVEHPCLVFLDLIMPGMNGWEFFEKLREKHQYDNLPVIVHTSAPSRAPDGVTMVLKKPVQIERLLAVAKEYC